MKRIYLLITIILFTFSAFLIIVLKPRNYTYNYQLNEFNIAEQYIKKEGYLFAINYKNTNYPLFIKQNYSRKRKYIKNIEIYEYENEVCLNVNVFNNNYYICSNNDSLKTLDTMSTAFLEKYEYKLQESSILETYQNINIYNKDLTYLIWNYKGYYQINNQNNSTLISFSKDNYNNNLSYQTGNYLVFPDYDSDYYFTKLYIYDIKNNKLNEIDFNFEISYDSYYLGTVNQSVYLLDKKNQNEYEINLKKHSLKKISKEDTALIYNGSKWEEITLTKLINNETKFPINNLYNYILNEGKLYLNIKDYQILITNEEVKKIVYTSNNKVYYLAGDSLYSYEYLGSSNLLLKYSEWNFNYNNHIFIYN